MPAKKSNGVRRGWRDATPIAIVVALLSAAVPFASLALLCASCQNAKYVDPKGNELVVNVDRMNIQDWSMLADQVVQSMVSSGTLARLPSQPAGLLLNPVANTTTQQFDTDAIMKKIRIALMNTGRVEVIMADDLFGGAEDRIAREAQRRKELGAEADQPHRIKYKPLAR